MAVIPDRPVVLAVSTPVRPEYHSTVPPLGPMKLVKSPAGKLAEAILRFPVPDTTPPVLVPKLWPAKVPQSNVEPELRVSEPHELLATVVIVWLFAAPSPMITGQVAQEVGLLAAAAPPTATVLQVAFTFQFPFARL